RGGHMKNQATLLSENHSAKENTLFLGIELSRKKWKLGFSDGKQMRARIRTIVARDIQALGAEIEQAKKQYGLSAGARTVSCYEAGREGFWVHRALREKGIENVIVDAASIDIKRRKRAKEDRLLEARHAREHLAYPG